MSALLREALAELVRLHELDNWAGSEEAYGVENFTRWNEAGEEVRRGFPLAWEAARRALASPPPQAPDPMFRDLIINGEEYRITFLPDGATWRWNGPVPPQAPSTASPEVESLPPLTDEQIEAICEKAWSDAETETANRLEAAETEWTRYGVYIAKAVIARLSEARPASDRDTDWILAMASALGPDSGFRVPIVPTPEAFKELFAALSGHST